MALSEYNPKLLNFLYELTKLDRFMSHNEISKRVKINEKPVSPKTVERYFKYLKKPFNHPDSLSKDKFDYFPRFLFEKLGLTYFYAFVHESSLDLLKSHEFSEYQNYALWVFDYRTCKNVLVIGYPIPIKHRDSFKKAWKKARENGLCGQVDICEIHSGYTLYSPLHKCFDESGNFMAIKSDSNLVDEHFSRLNKYLSNLPKREVDPLVKRNPLIIPSLFEIHLKSWSSQGVWDGIKKSLKNKVWNYILKKKDKTDGVGVKKVQQAFKQINESNIFNQMKLVYIPIQIDNLFFFLTLSAENSRELSKNIIRLLKNSIQISLGPFNEKKTILMILANQKQVPYLFDSLSEMDVSNLYLSQHKKSLGLLSDDKITSFNYSKLFDPIKKQWK